MNGKIDAIPNQLIPVKKLERKSTETAETLISGFNDFVVCCFAIPIINYPF
jgi:hypothetical protein